jgi:hypothetical protein
VTLPAALALAGCGTEATDLTTLRCTAGGTPPPTDCAFLQMVARDGTGNVIPFVTVKVDSVIGLGVAYRSGSAPTAGDGGFSLLVFRVNRFQQPTVPDTATVEVKVYNGTTPVSRAAVRMHFSPLEEVLLITAGTATFIAYP